MALNERRSESLQSEEWRHSLLLQTCYAKWENHAAAVENTVNLPQEHSQRRWSPKRCVKNIAARSGGDGLFPFERRILAGGPPRIWRTPRLILLLFGGIPNSPSVLEMSFKQMLAGQCES